MYYLMNKNNIVATFKENEDPLEKKFELIDFTDGKMPIGFIDINSWLENRQVGKHKKHIRELMAECGCLTAEGYIRITHATSLNDTFWVKRKDEKIQWDKVSLFENEFDDVIAKISFEGGGLYGKEFSTTTPEFSTDGSYEKCWKRENDKIYLYKRGWEGASNVGLEPFCEVYTSQIAKVLCKNAVSYELNNLHGRIASKCKLFTSEKVGFSPISLVCQKKLSPREILDFYEKLGCGDDFRRMVILDSITFNTDRHMGNHGIIFNSDTLEIIGMAPVFDENLSLLPYAVEEELLDIGHYLKTRLPSIGDDFARIAKSLMTPSIRTDLINLKDFRFKVAEHDKFPLSRVKILEKIINQQINGILDKSKIYTADIFPEQTTLSNVEGREKRESVLYKLHRNQEKVNNVPKEPVREIQEPIK